MYAIEHHGIKGMRWGVRRFQNPDGSLTSSGKARYYDSKRSTDSPERINKNTKVNEITDKSGVGKEKTKKALIAVGAVGAAAATAAIAISLSKHKMNETDVPLLNDKNSYSVDDFEKDWPEIKSKIFSHMTEVKEKYTDALNRNEEKREKNINNAFQQLLDTYEKAKNFDTRDEMRKATQDSELYEWAKDNRDKIKDIPAVVDWLKKYE